MQKNIENIYLKLQNNNNSNSFIFKDIPKYNFKEYYINSLNIMKEKLNFNVKIDFIEFENYILCYYNLEDKDLNKPIQNFINM